MKNKLTQNSIIFLLTTVLGMATVFVFYFSILKSNNSSDTLNSEKCIVSGCNNELCTAGGDREGTLASICLYKEEYECLKYAKCELNNDNKCGWTTNIQYNNCMRKYQTRNRLNSQ